MITPPRLSALLLSIALLAFGPALPAQQSAAGSSASSRATAAPSTGILPSAEAERLLPASILFKGQLAPVQARNSGAVRSPDGSLLIAALVDSSGYSTGVRERFQFFLYTELPLSLGGKTLPPGFYGAGFLADNTMIVLDVSGHDLMKVPTSPDPSLKRPRPLQIVPGPGAGQPRLYLGRSYIDLKTAR